MDVKLRENLETLKNLGKDQKQVREPILKELVDRVFSDMLNEIQFDTTLMDVSSMPARRSR
jgi:hypothetical protein